MAVKCEIIINCSKKAFTKIQILLPNMEYLRGHRCERLNMAYKCHVFDAANRTSYEYYYFVYIHMSVQFQCEIFMNCSNKFIGICKKKKNDCQTWNTKGIIDVVMLLYYITLLLT